MFDPYALVRSVFDAVGRREGDSAVGVKKHSIATDYIETYIRQER